MSALSWPVAAIVGALGGGLIFAAAAGRDRTLGQSTRSQIAEFLTGAGRPNDGSAIFCRTLHVMFQSLFADRQWSAEGFGRLAVASSFVVMATLCVPGAKYPDMLARLADDPDIKDVLAGLPLLPKVLLIVAVLSASVTVFNGIPEFLVLWKSRLWLRFIERKPTRLNIIYAAFCDILGSILIDVGAAVSITLVDDWLEEPPVSLTRALGDNFGATLAGLKELVGVPSGEPTDIVSLALSIATLMGCLWLALSVAAIALVKLWVRLSRSSRGLPRQLDFATRPIRGLGMVAGALFAVTPLAYCLI
jgi:hypothetical protein